MHGARGFRGGRGGAASAAPPADPAEVAGWLVGRLPDGWFAGAPEVSLDRDEILVVGRLPDVEVDGDDATVRSAAEAGRIRRFRDETRTARMAVAREAAQRYGRTVSWGASCGGTRELFTTVSVPVMTRLAQPEREVLDTLVDGGVARSRSEALAWCVRLVSQHSDTWLAELREALKGVQEVRRSGPDAAA